MGFFDKIKAAANAVTGGAASVHIEVEQPTVSGPFNVKVTATVDEGQTVKIDAVYVRIRAAEEVRMQGDRVMGRIKDALGDAVSDLPGLDIFEHDEETFDERFNISGPEELEGGQTYTWEKELQLPPGCAPSFTGKNTKHEWFFFAGLDAFGNDPDSGWQEILVRG